MEMFDLVEVPEEQHGVFFAGDCYVILYAYRLVMVVMMVFGITKGTATSATIVFACMIVFVFVFDQLLFFIYIMILVCSDGKRDCYIIYYWLGSNSSQDEQV